MRGPVKVERASTLRRRVVLAVWVVGAVAVVARGAQVQLLQADLWREAALRQHRTTREVAAPRGAILDRHGLPLAVSREVVRVSIAPGEIRDVERVRQLLVGTLGLSPAGAARHMDPSRRWSVVPGSYPPAVSTSLTGVRGIHVERLHQRFYPRGELARGVLGAVVDGAGMGGVEEVFDGVLRGVPGREVAARDNQGREIPGEAFIVEKPVPGGEVRLTLDLDLQEIAHEALSAALRSTGARGGDLVVVDPRTGEILALVSARGGRSDVLSAINAPYEPGSTLKPFTVAAVLEHGAGQLSDTVDARMGVWMVGGRPMTDVVARGRITLADALRVSSNIGVAVAARDLHPGEQYQMLRDFGFGVQAGISLPGEAPGTLRRPRLWSARSSASLAIGYEIGVTPLQMAMAYGALANGGVLLEPLLIREVRAPEGALLERPRPREVRRVVSPDVARQVTRVLVDVVEGGTGTAARLETFQVAGKTGTSRAYTAGGGYGGGHISSFGAFFPADDPQLVVFVKLEAPQGAYYGGATAAPVTRATMEAALAARRTPLDRRALLQSARPQPSAPPEVPGVGGAVGVQGAVRFASTGGAALSAPPGFAAAADVLVGGSGNGDGEVVRGGGPIPDGADSGPVPVPAVAGLPPRVAVRRLHAAGLRVVWDGTTRVTGSFPAAGAKVLPGDTVRLLGGAVRR